MSLLLRGHQALDKLSLVLFQEYDEEIQSEIGNDEMWTSNIAPFTCLFKQSDFLAQDYDHVMLS